jgi:hypothetical protein
MREDPESLKAYMLYGGSASSGGSSSDPYKTAVIDTIVAEVQSTIGEDRAVLLLVSLCNCFCDSTMSNAVQGYKDQMEEMFQASQKLEQLCH